MTVNGAMIAIGTTLKHGMGKVVSAIGNASIGSLIRAGVIIGTACITIGLTVRKFWQKMKLWKRQRNDRKNNDNQDAALGDIATDVNYANPHNRRNMDELMAKMNKSFNKKLSKKSKSGMKLSKEDREQIRRFRNRIAEMILGEDYDPSIDYVDPHVAKMAADIAHLGDRKREHDRYEKEHPDNHVLWRIAHPYGI